MGLTPERQNRSNIKGRRTILWIFLCADILILLSFAYRIFTVAVMRSPIDSEPAQVFWHEYQAGAIAIYVVTGIVMSCIGVVIVLKLKGHKSDGTGAC